MLGENCSAGCMTRDHATWGECMRAKNARVVWCKSAAGLDATAEKAKDAQLAAYRAVRKEGSQPASTSPAHVRRAKRMSDGAGKAYSA